MSLQRTVHTALDEVRMQMLGAQVLFGFQLQGVFQEGFDRVSSAAQICDAASLGLIVVTLGLLIAGPSQHRFVERGQATGRILRVANRFAELALASFAAALALDVYVVTEGYVGVTGASICASAAAVLALVLWYGLGLAVRAQYGGEGPMRGREPVALHEKINQMLTEARVMLPGAQALLGFDFVVTMTKAFAALPAQVQAVHFCALAAIAISMMLLISPAAVHRIAFGGRDSDAMHAIGSILITLALVPLAVGIAGDVYVVVWKIAGHVVAVSSASAVLIFLALLWYGLPLVVRSRMAG